MKLQLDLQEFQKALEVYLLLKGFSCEGNILYRYQSNKLNELVIDVEKHGLSQQQIINLLKNHDLL